LGIITDVDQFRDKKQILIFSEKGGTGNSYQAALDVINPKAVVVFIQKL
jgi:hypothetical protein